MHRAPWVELETDDEDSYTLIHPGWTNDPDGLPLAIREAGWYSTNREVFAAAERAELSWGWVGVDEDGELRECRLDGTTDHVLEGSDPLQDVESVTFAKISGVSR